jgi:hypothetical protein
MLKRCSVCPILLACLVSFISAAAAPPEEAGWWSVDVDAALARAGDRRPVWKDALHRAPVAHRDAVAFLVEHMPTRDLMTLDADFVLDNVASAYAAREAVPWGKDIPEAIFLNDVLPYVNISEQRGPWRVSLKKRFLPVVMDCTTPGEAAHRLNQVVFPELGVKYSTARERADQSPSETIGSGIASCTGLSILLTDACRAVGVPARLAGIPNWVNKNGNHTWVEIWDGGAWHFVGAAEPDPRGLNHAWFVGDAALARREQSEHAIYAISYRRTGLEFPLRFDPEAEAVPAVNVTARYARPGARTDDETRLLVRVVDRGEKRLAAEVTVRNPANATATYTGVSRDESYDTNDVLAFTLSRGNRFEITVRSGEIVARETVDTAGPEQTVTVVVSAGGKRPRE